MEVVIVVVVVVVVAVVIVVGSSIIGRIRVADLTISTYLILRTKCRIYLASVNLILYGAAFIS